MKASLDTNVIIHLYRAGQKQILFRRFAEGIYIYEQIRNIELEHHGQDIIREVDEDIANKQITLITDADLRQWGVLNVFQRHVRENRLLYTPKDLGEVYAISLAETLGIFSLVTDDTKQGGPYMSLMQFEGDEIMPFTFADILFLNYLDGMVEAEEVLEVFEDISEKSGLNWNLRGQLVRFVKRFWREPYREQEKVWMKDFCAEHKISTKDKLAALEKVV